ncbi:mucin-2-like [Ochlerotatus camptorhynchus]|uniref:mucin-2-like n=1 Tax=Ochlerotatus camptorhynchus TaxID=644619 RepID=UPI0031E21D81
MLKVVLVVLSVAAVAAGNVIQCTEEFVAQHGSLLPFPGSCQKFLVCASGWLEERNCPSGMLFDVDSNRCTSEANAKCSSEKWSKTNGLCNAEDEVSTYPDPYHCARYVLCLGLTAIPRQCSTGLLFNSQTGKCDFPPNVICDVSCPIEGNDLVFLPESSGQSCARYFICLNGNPHPAECSSMLYFDLVTGTCMRPADASCSIKGVYCSEHDEKIADPRSCYSYYQCEGGFPHYQECEVGHHFMNGQCVPGDCDDGITEDTGATTEVDPSTTEMSTSSSTVIDSTTPTVTETEQSTTDSTSVPPTESSTVTDTTVDTSSTEEPSTATPTEQSSTTESTSPSSSTELTTATQTEQTTTSVPPTESSTATDTTDDTTNTEDPSTATPTEQSSTTESTSPSSSTDLTTATQTDQTTTSVPPTESSTVTDTTVDTTNTEDPSTATPTEQPSTTESTSPSSSTELTTATQTEQTTTSVPSTESSTLTDTTVDTTNTGEPSTATPTEQPSTTESTTTQTEQTTAVTSNPTTDSSTDAQSTTSASTSVSTTDAITTSTLTPTTTIDPADICRDVDIGVVPHPYNCYQYFVCIFGSGREATCSDGHIFDSQVSVCVPGDRDACTRNPLLAAITENV